MGGTGVVGVGSLVDWAAANGKGVSVGPKWREFNDLL